MIHSWTFYLVLWALIGLIPAIAQSEPLPVRGYYITFMRVPTLGFDEWKQMIDRIQEDGGNTVILWTAGAFKSRKFPITWAYNKSHRNIQSDFVRSLIDYAHERGMRVVLGFTPYAYDGVNQYPIEKPLLKATQKDGQPAQYWGLHSWGYNLCPAQPETQQFMLEYVREMFFEFYPNADGLMIESSDYAICHCSQCGSRFFDREFEFVKAISDEVWSRKHRAIVMVYPRYFEGRPVPGFSVSGARQPFDPRWWLFFTPHSAHIEPGLIRQSKQSVYWNEGLTLSSIWKIRDGARYARQNGITGFLPSLEPFTCPSGPPENPGPSLKPFHFEWLREGEMPLDELLMRLSRFAYQQATLNPEISDAALTRAIAERFFGSPNRLADASRLIYLHESFFLEADWFNPSPLVNPARLETSKPSPEKLQSYEQRISRLRILADHYKDSSGAIEQELSRIANYILAKWKR